MTQAPERQALTFETIDEVVGELRRAGHRVSTPARLVLEALFRADGPISAEWIAQPHGDRALPLEMTSVYRNLERLQQLGVVSHVHVGHGPGLYVLSPGTDREYLVCDRCGRVTTVDPAALDTVREQLRETYGHHARFSHFPVHGYCRACAHEVGAHGEAGRGAPH